MGITNYDRHLQTGIPMAHSLDYHLALKAGVGEPGKLEGSVMINGNIYLLSDKAEVGAVYPPKRDLGVSLVHEFHEVFNCAIGESPSVPKAAATAQKSIVDYADLAAETAEALKASAASAKADGDEAGALLLIRLQLIQEELAELADAMSRHDVVGSLDALVDITYVTDGTYITLGLHDHKVAGLLEVHRSNMSKLDEEGKPIISDAGRVVKGPRYSPPDLAKVLA